MSDAWLKSAEEFLWSADILQTMGRYAQALLLACHALDICEKANRKEYSKEPLSHVPRKCIELIFPQGDKTPEDLVSEEESLNMINTVKKCLGL